MDVLRTKISPSTVVFAFFSVVFVFLVFMLAYLLGARPSGESDLLTRKQFLKNRVSLCNVDLAKATDAHHSSLTINDKLKESFMSSREKSDLASDAFWKCDTNEDQIRSNLFDCEEIISQEDQQAGQLSELILKNLTTIARSPAGNIGSLVSEGANSKVSMQEAIRALLREIAERRAELNLLTKACLQENAMAEAVAAAKSTKKRKPEDDDDNDVADDSDFKSNHKSNRDDAGDEDEFSDNDADADAEDDSNKDSKRSKNNRKGNVDAGDDSNKDSKRSKNNRKGNARRRRSN